MLQNLIAKIRLKHALAAYEGINVTNLGHPTALGVNVESGSFTRLRQAVV